VVDEPGGLRAVAAENAQRVVVGTLSIPQQVAPQNFAPGVVDDQQVHVEVDHRGQIKIRAGKTGIFSASVSVRVVPRSPVADDRRKVPQVVLDGAFCTHDVFLGSGLLQARERGSDGRAEYEITQQHQRCHNREKRHRHFVLQGK
jgi:hypothetical protein